MTNRINLSPDTWIEEADGKLWLCTRDQIVETQLRVAGVTTHQWDANNDGNLHTVAPLLAAHEHCYRRRDGEPWCAPDIEDAGHTTIIIDSWVLEAVEPGDPVLHADAAKLCGYDPDSLRRYLGAVEDQTPRVIGGCDELR